MRIGLDEIDPHVAAMVAVTAPADKSRVPAPRRLPARLSRRRRAALVAAQVAPPMLGLQLAIWATDASHANSVWLPFVIWFGIWAIGTGLGSRAVLRGRLQSRSSAGLMTVTALAAPMLSFAAAIAAFSPGPAPSFLAFWTTWLAIALPLALLGSHLALSVGPRSRQITTLQTEGLSGVFAAMSLTRAERVYCDVLLFLACVEVGGDMEPIMRGALAQVNELLASSRQLESRRAALLPLRGAHVEVELRRERLALQSRLQSATDPVARAALEQSLHMVETRIENARNLETGLERLNAQQEAVTQTMASTLSSLARLQVTSHAATGSAIQDVTQTLADMNQQTYAVEKAVEEVLMLRQ